MNATSNGLGFIRAIGAGKGWSGSSAWRLDTPRNRIVLRDQWGQDCLIEGMTVASLDDQRKISPRPKDWCHELPHQFLRRWMGVLLPESEEDPHSVL